MNIIAIDSFFYVIKNELVISIIQFSHIAKLTQMDLIQCRVYRESTRQFEEISVILNNDGQSCFIVIGSCDYSGSIHVSNWYGCECHALFNNIHYLMNIVKIVREYLIDYTNIVCKTHITFDRLGIHNKRVYDLGYDYRDYIMYWHTIHETNKPYALDQINNRYFEHVYPILYQSLNEINVIISPHLWKIIIEYYTIDLDVPERSVL